MKTKSFSVKLQIGLICSVLLLTAPNTQAAENGKCEFRKTVVNAGTTVAQGAIYLPASVAVIAAGVISGAVLFGSTVGGLAGIFPALALASVPLGVDFMSDLDSKLGFNGRSFWVAEQFEDHFCKKTESKAVRNEAPQTKKLDPQSAEPVIGSSEPEPVRAGSLK